MVGRDVNKEKIASYESENITIFQMKTKQIEIQDVLHLLGEKQILSLFVEGGKQFMQASYKQSISMKL